MSDQNDNQNGNGDAPRPRRGRPPQPRAETLNALEARLSQILEEAKNRPDVESRSLEEIVEYNRRLMTQLQNLLMEDMKTISVRNVARVQTPNGLSKQDLGGLPKDTREYLMKLYEHCSKALALAEQVIKDESIDPEKKFEMLADKLYRGIPGLKLTK